MSAATTFNSASGHAILPVTVLRPRRGWQLLDVAALWRYRDLLLLLAQRDVLVRYKQTALGAAWAIIQPLVAMCVLHLFFGKALGVANRVGDVPYPIFLYAGLLPWTFFAATVTASSTSLVKHAGILTKVYFPRLLVPLAAAGGPLVDYAVASVVLLGMMLFYSVGFAPALLLMPLLIASVVIAALGVGVLLAAVTVWYRDVQHAVPFLVQTALFVTPVIYPVTLVPETWQWLLYLNPMCGPIEAMRAAILGTPLDVAGWAASTGVGVVLLGVGTACFQRVERAFADVV